MIKVTSGREDVECLFGKHIGIVGVLRGEGNFIFLSGDGKFSGESSFSDVFVIKGDGSLYPVYMGVVLHQPRHSQNYLGSPQSYDHKG